MKHLLAFLLACVLSITIAAGPDPFPAPATGEYGPQAAAPDGLTLADHLDGNGSTFPPSAAPDNNGAFRFICGPGQVNADDPVVFPGQKGRSHRHQFYGNLGTNWASTYASQRAAGDSTCQNALNRTGYWMPGMISGGKVLRPEFISIYYKREPKGSPECTPSDPKFVGNCIGIPNAIRFIMGADLVSLTTPTGSTAFKCVSPSQTTNRSNFLPDMVQAASFCQPGDYFVLFIAAPECWDGNNLDSANHRSHVAYLTENYKCPPSHPNYMPHFQLQAFFLVDANLNRTGTWSAGQNTWYLDSDIMLGTRPGVSFHADYFEGWNPLVKKAWTDNCIDKMLNCSGGDLGNGYALKQEFALYQGLQRYVPVPPMAMEPFRAKIGAPK